MRPYGIVATVEDGQLVLRMPIKNVTGISVQTSIRTRPTYEIEVANGPRLEVDPATYRFVVESMEQK